MMGLVALVATATVMSTMLLWWEKNYIKAKNKIEIIQLNCNNVQQQDNNIATLFHLFI